MKNNSIYTILFVLVLFSCTKRQEEKSNNNFAPKVIESTGSVVSKDSMVEPKTILIDKSKLTRIPAGKPTIIPTNTNVHIAGIPKIISAGVPRIITPGTDTFLIPETLPAIEYRIVAGIPEVILAKDAHIKDNNPQNFSSFSKLQGLKHSTIRCILQDKRGNLWFGTDGGVSKYDGKYFTHFTEKEGLVNNLVYSILLDKSGDLWFGTIGGKICKYDGKYFTTFTQKEGWSKYIVWSILQDKDGNIWFGTDSGVSKYDGKSFTYFTVKEGLPNNNVSSILEDKNGNLWFGTESGMCKYDGKSFTHFTENKRLANNKVSSILQDKNGNLWFGTNGGVSKYDGKSFTYFTEKEGLPNNNVLSILEDKNGNLWFGTQDGVCRYNGNSEVIANGKKNKQSVSIAFTHFTEKEGLSNNLVNAILQDKSGNIWFGTDDGVNKFDGKSFTNYTKTEGLSYNKVMSIVQDYNGNLWLGTYDGGVSKYNGNSFAHYTEKEGLSDKRVWSILQDKNGNLWFGTENGVCKFDGKYFIYYAEKDGLINNLVFSMLQDKSGNIWFGTERGLSKFDGKSFTNFTEKEGLSNNMVISILQDKSGNLWFGTFGGGVSKYDGKSFTHFTEKEGLLDNRVWSILQDKSGNLWFGTYGGGVSKYDGKSFTQFTEKEGLSNNFVFSMIEDKTGNIWFGTRFGLNKLSTKNYQKIVRILDKSMSISEHLKPIENDVYFKYYGYEDGFLGIGVNVGQTIYEAKDGTIWIGANDRLVAFHPEGDEPDTLPPNMQVTNIDLYSENINWINLAEDGKGNNNNTAKDTSLTLGNGVILSNFEFDSISRWYYLPENLSLAYNNNYLTFKYIGITQLHSDKVKYQYKLDGIDVNWSAISSRTEASYGNLPHGSYTFKVKAMNSEGYWSKECSYCFTIRPPWWKTLFFMIGIWLMGIMGLLSIYYWRVKSLKKRQKRLELLVIEKTAEVVRQKDKILAQRNELEVVNATKDKFFSIIAHDLRSPFNSILGFSDLLLKQVQNKDLEKIDNFARIIQQSSHRAMELLRNLLEWAQSQTGGIRFNPKYFDVADLNASLIPIFDDIARQKSIIIKKAFPPNIHVYADKDMISTIFRNLISNAIKFTKDGGEIIVSAEERQNEVIGSVSDNGIGIEETRLINLFRLDELYSTADTNDEKGTGLGLILCKEFVEKHGGKIWVESTVGIGTSFYFSLPLRVDNK
jgi:ligand-binding sensor domain-containing protein/signal transduction histidine kinase